ncbi:penicillin-binding protein 1C [Cupriavidus gilardii]|uniref:penicillin-binding protein 1C n=1 Tax=Cupriavidus gilardii TaxID=82541 RepID=UPI0021BE5425|nr:penicillin-binding protein 1C [Cupriavidus gilardii]MCT9126141.1 penicillin-binding protein 1C [Cupriavidus gilardii]
MTRATRWPGIRRAARAAALLGALLSAIPSAPAFADALPGFDQVRGSYRSADVIVRDRHGEPVATVRTDFGARRGQWVALDEISPAVRTAIVLSEDRRFYRHSGVDWQGVAGAAWANLWNTRTRGASTLTMQLAALLDDELRRGAGGRSAAQKMSQAWRAARLEQGWSKSQILEAYLNLVPLRGELVGLSALSQGLFGKLPSGLDAREAALAVALVRAPNAAPARVAQRACQILREMAQPDGCNGLDGFTQLALARAAMPPAGPGRAQLAPHLGRLLVERTLHSAGTTAPAAIDSTLDAGVQRLAMASLQRHLRELAGRHVEDGAVVVLDNASGDVLAYVGSSGALSAAAQVDHAAALRQAGSTLKPFLYAQALEERRLTAASLLDDRPVNLPTGGGLYIPRNYDGRYGGWVSMRAALAGSLNVPAVRTLVMVTPHRFHRRLVALGLPLTEAGDYYGYSLALGSADVSLLTLTNAYRTLANQGRQAPVRMRLAEPAPRPLAVMSAAAAHVIGDVLSDRHARARTFGLDSPLTTRFWTAVKTGTSKDMRDNWCIGWSQHYTVGVWVGNASGAAMRDVSGVSGAAPVWHDVMAYLHRERASRPPAMPADVERVPVRFEGVPEPAREEVFLAGTAVPVVAVGSHHAGTAAGRGAGRTAAAHGADTGRAATIASPADGTVFALDPDIPPQAQRVWLHAEDVAGRTARAVAWRLDGKRLGRGGKLAWLPWPGRHRLELLDAGGTVLDTVRIEVRGATVREGRDGPPPGRGRTAARQGAAAAAERG